MITEYEERFCIKVAKVPKSRGGKYEPIDPAPVLLFELRSNGRTLLYRRGEAARDEMNKGREGASRHRIQPFSKTT